MAINATVRKDLRFNWHPSTQMKDTEIFPPAEIESARGAYIHLKSGKTLIDGISSWWCKNLGHRHPLITRGVKKQLDKFEHVIFANTTHKLAADVSRKIIKTLAPYMQRVFYGGDGATAVEIAMKMSYQYHRLHGTGKNKFAFLENSYHGETILAYAVSDLGRYKNHFKRLLPAAVKLGPVRYTRGPDDPLWMDCSSYWPAINQKLERHKKKICAVILEPVVQGAGGMLIYSPELIKKIRQWCTANKTQFIAD